MSSGATRLLPGDPSRVGRFEMVGRLGEGGMGVVYLGRGEAGELAAVKLVHPGFAADPGFRARFAREVQALRQVRGPFTAALLDADAEAAQPWLAMAYVPGPTLEQAVDESGPLPAGRVLAVGLGVAGALQLLHGAGWLHRDLKPGNVILSVDGPRVIDLGIAHPLGGTVLTQTGAVVGTRTWMAPEQWSGMGESAATDMFAWACLVVFAATGRHPYGPGRPEAVGLRVLHEQPDLSGLEHLDRALVVGVVRCLAKDPGRRLTAGQVLAATTGHTGAERTSVDRAAVDLATRAWVGVPFGEGSAGPVVPGSPGMQPLAAELPGTVLGSSGGAIAATARPLSRRRRGIALTAGALVVAGGVAVAVAAHNQGTPDASEAEDPAAAVPSAAPGGGAKPTPRPSTATPTPRPSTATPTPRPEVVILESTSGMTLSRAREAAERSTCAGCVEPVFDQEVSEESASRGLVQFGINDGFEAAWSFWGYTGSSWGQMAQSMDVLPLPTRLPARIWVCTDSSATNVRAGPGSSHPVIDEMGRDTPVDATFLRLDPQPSGADGWPGWFAISARGQRGWVSSTRVAITDGGAGGCDVWRNSREDGAPVEADGAVAPEPDLVNHLYPVSWSDGVTVRSEPRKGSEAIQWLPYQTVVHVVCRVKGEAAVTKTGKTTNWWDRIDSPAAGYITDARIDTGGLPPEVPLC